MEMGFHLLRRAGYDEAFIGEVARVMEYSAAYELYPTGSQGLWRGTSPYLLHRGRAMNGFRGELA